MNRKFFFISIIIICLVFSGCSSIPLNSYRKGNSFFIENIDGNGNVIGIDNIVINNITFFDIKYEILGIKNLETSPKQLNEGTVSSRDDKTILIKNIFSNSPDSLANYSYICINFPEGTLKKCTAYSEHNDICIDIEQYGIEPNKNLHQIDEELFIELENAFRQ